MKGEIHLVSFLLQGINETYKKGIKDMSNLVLVKFNNDAMIEPKESQVMYL